MEANKYAFHSTVHASTDHDGFAGGYGGGGDASALDVGWNGPRDFVAKDYGPGSACIDTTQAFRVTVAFPLGRRSGLVKRLDVTLFQASSGGGGADDAGANSGDGCSVGFTAAEGYPGLAEVTAALSLGMTPVVSYWSSPDMEWMDGRGVDGLGPCADYDQPKCNTGSTATLGNFVFANRSTLWVDDDGGKSKGLATDEAASTALAILFTIVGVWQKFEELQLSKTRLALLSSCHIALLSS